MGDNPLGFPGNTGLTQKPSNTTPANLQRPNVSNVADRYVVPTNNNGLGRARNEEKQQPKRNTFNRNEELRYRKTEKKAKQAQKAADRRAAEEAANQPSFLQRANQGISNVATGVRQGFTNAVNYLSSFLPNANPYQVTKTSEEAPVVAKISRRGLNQQGTTTTTKKTTDSTTTTVKPTDPTTTTATTTKKPTDPTTTTTITEDAYGSGEPETSSSSSNSTTTTTTATSIKTTLEATISPDHAITLREIYRQNAELLRSLPISEQTPEIAHFLDLYDDLVNNIENHNPLYVREATQLGQSLNQIGRSGTTTTTTTTVTSPTPPATINFDYFREPFEEQTAIIERLNGTETSEAFTNFRNLHSEIQSLIDRGEGVPTELFVRHNVALSVFQTQRDTTTTTSITTPVETVAPQLLESLRDIYEERYNMFNAANSIYSNNTRISDEIALYNTLYLGSFASEDQTAISVPAQNIYLMNDIIRDIETQIRLPTTSTTTSTPAPATIARDQFRLINGTLALNDETYIQPYLKLHPDANSRTIEFTNFYSKHLALYNKLNPTTGEPVDVTEAEFTEYGESFVLSRNGTTFARKKENDNLVGSLSEIAGLVMGCMIAASAMAASFYAYAYNKWCFAKNRVEDVADSLLMLNTANGPSNNANLDAPLEEQQNAGNAGRPPIPTSLPPLHRPNNSNPSTTPLSNRPGVSLVQEKGKRSEDEHSI